MFFRDLRYTDRSKSDGVAEIEGYTVTIHNESILNSDFRLLSSDLMFSMQVERAPRVLEHVFCISNPFRICISRACLHFLLDRVGY